LLRPSNEYKADHLGELKVDPATDANSAATFTARLTDNRGASCVLNLSPTTSALISSGRCVLANSGAPGAITITPVYDTFSGAFGDPSTGGNVTQSANFMIPAN
jgi:hypothetical protein